MSNVLPPIITKLPKAIIYRKCPGCGYVVSQEEIVESKINLECQGCFQYNHSHYVSIDTKKGDAGYDAREINAQTLPLCTTSNTQTANYNVNSMRTRDFETGVIREGVKEIIRLHNDGYRIYFSWVQGAPLNCPTELELWAEYKHCDIPAISDSIVNLLMVEGSPTIEETKPKYRAEFLALAQKCGAVLTGKPDGSESITIAFTVDAWRAFDLANKAGDKS